MTAAIDDLKINFLSQIQTNEYDKALSTAQEILALDPKDQLISKFSKFLQSKKEYIKQVDRQEAQKANIIIEDDSNTAYESDQNSDYSISSDSQSSEEQVLDQVIMKQNTPKKVNKVVSKPIKTSSPSTLPKKK